MQRRQKKILAAARQKKQARSHQARARVRTAKPYSLLRVRKRLQSMFPNPSQLCLCIRGRLDGIGAQSCANISAMVTAKALGISYLYSPFKHIDHYPYPDPSSTESRVWIEMWEDMLGFRRLEHNVLEDLQGTKIVNIDRRSVPNLFHTQIDRLKQGTVYASRDCHEFTNLYADDPILQEAWKSVTESLHQSYGLDRSDTPHFKKEHNNLEIEKPVFIALHIRLGDAAATQRRTLPLSYYTNKITELVQLEDPDYFRSISSHEDNKLRLHFHVYSEGDPRQFDEIVMHCRKLKVNCCLHINDDPYVTLHHMICADVLVMAKSTFSFLAKLYGDPNRSVIIPEEWWLKG